MTVRITSACTACGACLITCPTSALSPAPGRPDVRDEACTDCLACIEVCPAGAIFAGAAGAASPAGAVSPAGAAGAPSPAGAAGAPSAAGAASAPRAAGATGAELCTFPRSLGPIVQILNDRVQGSRIGTEFRAGRPGPTV